MPETGRVREMRLAVTATDHDEAVWFYRDVPGLPMREAEGAEEDSRPDARLMALDTRP